MISRSLSLVAAIAVATTSAFACGPSPAPTDPSATGTAPTSTPTADPTAGGGAEAPAPSPTGKDPAPAPAPAKVVEPVSVTPSKMVAELKKLGIDPAKYPDLSKIPLAKKKKLMPLFQKSLGMADCQGCHAEDDYKKETKNIKMAQMMWKYYVQGLKIDPKVVKGGGALFCDSCHAGKEHVLPRHDDEAMNNFMTTEYEGKLVRADGKNHACTTCHGEGMEYAIFKNMWGIK